MRCKIGFGVLFFLLFCLGSVSADDAEEAKEAEVPAGEAIAVSTRWLRYRITDNRGFPNVRIMGQSTIENVSDKSVKKVEIQINIVNQHGVKFEATDPTTFYKMKAGKSHVLSFERLGLPTVGADQPLVVVVTAKWKDSKGKWHTREVSARES